MSAALRYRFDPLDRSVVFGLGWSQLAVLGVGSLCWFVAVMARLPIIPATAVFGLTCAFALAPVMGQPACTWVPTVAAWVGHPSRARRWYRPLHLTTATAEAQPVLPPWLAGLSLVDVPAGWGAVWDSGERTLTAVFPIAGQGFVTRPEAEQEWLLSGWGAVFTAFADSSAVEVARVCWSDVARTEASDAHLGWASAQPGADSPLGRSYREFVVAQRVTLTVRARQRGAAVSDRLMEGMAAAAESLSDALSEARLVTPGPLTAPEIASVLRGGLDPSSVVTGPRRQGRLADRLGVVDVADAGPMTTKVATNHLEVDGSVHRVYWVVGWPELAQAAGWFKPLLAADDDSGSAPSGGGHRVFTVIVEPIAEDRALRQVATDDVKLGSDALAKADAGRRVGARDRRKHSAVLQREEEIVSGASGLAYAGLVTLTAPNLEALDRAGRAYERRCYRRRVTLRVLWGRQDLALAAGLPLGLGLSRIEPR